MAYLHHLQGCVGCRQRAAVYELRSNVNAPIGSYCARCGPKALREREKYEAKERAARADKLDAALEELKR